MAYEDLPKMEIRTGDLSDLPTVPPSRQSMFWALERVVDPPFYRYHLFIATQAGTWAEIRPREPAFSDGFDSGFLGVAVAGASGGGGTDDKTVLVSGTDTVSDYLFSKIVGGAGISITQTNIGFDEKVTIASSGSKIIFTFNYLTSSPLTLFTANTNDMVDEIDVYIDVAFNQPATITIGESGNVSRLMSSTDIDPQTAQIYSLYNGYTYPSSTAVKLYISTTATSGSGRIVMNVLPT